MEVISNWKHGWVYSSVGGHTYHDQGPLVWTTRVFVPHLLCVDSSMERRSPDSGDLVLHFIHTQLSIHRVQEFVTLEGSASAIHQGNDYPLLTCKVSYPMNSKDRLDTLAAGTSIPKGKIKTNFWILDKIQFPTTANNWLGQFPGQLCDKNSNSNNIRSGSKSRGDQASPEVCYKEVVLGHSLSYSPKRIHLGLAFQGICVGFSSFLPPATC